MKTKQLRFLSVLLALSLLLVPPAFALEYGMANFQKTVVYTPFTDVPSDAWYAGDVQTAVELGLINGKGDGRFDPNGGLTLAEAVTMTVKIHARYWGEDFTPGGSPWYQNAVNYAMGFSIVLPGEYLDYTQSATRADMANLFAGALPISELPRINRIASIPDVDFSSQYADYIYYLYSGGIFTGDATGAFHLADGISRAEAAAIINRIALPASRKSVTLNQSAPWGTPMASKDGGFQLNVPNDWTQGEDDVKGLWCETADASAFVQVFSYPSEDYPGDTPQSMSGYLRELIASQYGEDAVLTEPSPVLFRGLPAYSFNFNGLDNQQWYASSAYAVRNSTGHYILIAAYNEHCTSEQWIQLMDVSYSFDLAL